MTKQMISVQTDFCSDIISSVAAHTRRFSAPTADPTTQDSQGLALAPTTSTTERMWRRQWQMP
jgi:hypothetical protein